MSLIVDAANAVYHAARLAALAFVLGVQLFYVIGPLMAGAALGCFAVYVCARYVAWPVARGGFRLLAWVGSRLFGRERVRRQVEAAWEATEPVAA